MKNGDTLNLSVFVTLLGAPQTYADAAAFLSAGGSFTWLDMQGAALAIQPTWTLTPDSDVATTGRHRLKFQVPARSSLRITAPTGGRRADPAEYLLDSTTADADTIYNALFAAIATPIAADRLSLYDWTSIESDAFYAEMTFPAALLAAWGYADLSAAGWTLSASGRLETDVSTSGAALFNYDALIVDGAARTIGIGWGTFPTEAALTTADIATGSRKIRFDVQASKIEAFTVTAATAGAGGTLTIAGDKRKYFSPNVSTTFAVVGGANAGTYTLASATLSGGNTVLQVTGNVPSAAAGGTISVTIKLTGISGTHTLKRQETKV